MGHFKGCTFNSSLTTLQCDILEIKLENEADNVCPVLSFKGVHRQVLFTTVGWFLGYHLSKYENYFYAKLERDMNKYIELHPEEFAQKGEQIITVATEDLFRELKIQFLHAMYYPYSF